MVPRNNQRLADHSLAGWSAAEPIPPPPLLAPPPSPPPTGHDDDPGRVRQLAGHNNKCQSSSKDRQPAAALLLRCWRRWCRGRWAGVARAWRHYSCCCRSCLRYSSSTKSAAIIEARREGEICRSRTTYRAAAAAAAAACTTSFSSSPSSLSVYSHSSLLDARSVACGQCATRLRSHQGTETEHGAQGRGKDERVGREPLSVLRCCVRFYMRVIVRQ